MTVLHPEDDPARTVEPLSPQFEFQLMQQYGDSMFMCVGKNTFFFDLKEERHSQEHFSSLVRVSENVPDCKC